MVFLDVLVIGVRQYDFCCKFGLVCGYRPSDDNVHVVRTFAEVIQLLSSPEFSSRLERAFVIGGESVYQACVFVQLICS